ncbi:ABC transporter ATP-binding protein/permease [Vibrio sp. J1-1]|uniref:ABC transporter ATP-binding protein/permease n=1 Tax=Vibrio sp. J1-1 TaxID=2912251 RepID=UPI0031F87B17
MHVLIYVLKNMSILKQFFSIAKPYWLSRASLLTWGIFITTVTVSLLLVQVTVKLNAWNKAFFDALAALDGPLIYDLLIQFIGFVAVIVVMKVYAKWLQQWAEIRWRTWLTERLVGRWLSNQNFYHLTIIDEPDNPDQRIAEDIKILTTETLNLILELIKSAATLIAFSVILWNLSSSFLLPLFGDIKISGYLLWLAVIYSIIGAGVTHFLGRKLHSLFYQQQKREADFRARLLRSRDSAEQIALMKGQRIEKEQLEFQFSDISSNWKTLMSREKKLGIVVNTYKQIAAMVPYFAAIPALMAKIITVGGLFQVRMAFMKVYSSLSWFIFRYDDLTYWSATVVRLSQFIEAMEKSEELSRKEQKQSTTDTHTAGIQCEQLSVCKPNGQVLIDNLNLDVKSGESIIIWGASGLGKSTLLRTLSGIWPFYQGRYHTNDSNVLVLPQKPYLAQRCLRECLSYPEHPSEHNAAYELALELVGLQQLIPELDNKIEWQSKLSGGEQQKLALARALVLKPSTLVLDESTSSLDECTAYDLVKLVLEQLPDSTILMVSHQSHLQPLFERSVELENTEQKNAKLRLDVVAI